MFVCCALPFTGYGYTTEPKPLRNPKQIKEYLKFARKQEHEHKHEHEHEHWLNEWNTVIWSDDEAHLKVLNSTNRVLVHRLKREMNESFNFVPRLQSGGVLSVYRYMSGGARDSFMNDL